MREVPMHFLKYHRDPKQKHAGVMIWVRKDIITCVEDIKCETIVSGRILIGPASP